jgi:hypothetical protein
MRKDRTLGMEPYRDDSGGRGIGGGANPRCLVEVVGKTPERRSRSIS